MRRLERDAAALSSAERKVFEHVDRYGWHCMHVSDADDPHRWSYSIGLLETWSHPEIVVFGLPADTAHALLSNVVDDVRSGTGFMPGDRYEVFVNGYDCVFLRVDPKWLTFLGFAVWFYGGDFEAVQCVWPDRNHRLPWEGGDDPHPQPLLISTEDERRLGYTDGDEARRRALGPDT